MPCKHSLSPHSQQSLEGGTGQIPTFSLQLFYLPNKGDISNRCTRGCVGTRTLLRCGGGNGGDKNPKHH